MKKLFFLLLLLAGMSQAQTTVSSFISPKQQFMDNSGAVCAGCLLDTFAAGGTTPLATYSESTGTTPNANPIVLDSAGRATIYLTSASYKFRLRSAAGVTLWTQDVVSWATPLSTFAGITSTGDVTLSQSTAATSGANQSSNNLKVQGTYWNGSASANDIWTLNDVLGTGTNPTSTLTLTHSGSSGTAALSFPNVNVSFGNVTASGDLALSTGKVIKWNIDTGLSRDSAGVVDVGNGTQGDKSGTISLTNLKLYKSDGTVPATIQNDTLGGFTLTTNNSLSLAFNTSGNLVLPSTGALSLQGSTSGTTLLKSSAIASGTLTLPAATDTLAVLGTQQNFTAIQRMTSNRVAVASDFTTANNTNLQNITGLSWTFPATAASYSYHCALLYSQATAAVSDTFGIQAVTNAPTNINANAVVWQNITNSIALGNLPTLTTTTATAFVTFTPGSTATVFNAYFDGTIELGASANTVNFMVSTSAGADAITIKRGSYCNLF